jgi:CHAT domain-containing protein
MGPAKKMLAAACLGVGLLAVSISAGAQQPALEEQIAQHQQKLAEARSAGRTRDEASELNALGGLYRQAGNMQKALEDLNQALTIEQNSGNRGGEAATRNAMGRVYTELGKEQKALELFSQTLPVWRKLGNRNGEANTLNNMGKAYNDLAQREKALECLNQALPIFQETGNRSGEARTLDNLGSTYASMGEARKGIDYFNQAQKIWREVEDESGEAQTLNNMGRAYADLGEKQKSLESCQRALAIWRAMGNRNGEATSLTNEGQVYRDLGRNQTALDYYNQALPIWREVGNRNGEARALNDIGRVYAETSQGRKALDFYNQALSIWRDVGNRRGEASTLNNIGRDYSALGEAANALDYDLQALTVWREVEDRRGESIALMTAGWTYSALKEPDKSVASSLAALSLAKDAGDPEVEGAIETSLMNAFRRQHHPEEAIFFGMDAVNSYQLIRRNISGLDKDLQAGFAESKSKTYRILAELLVETGRLGEAEQILDLLKEQELKDIVRGAAPDAAAKIKPLKLNAAQQKAQSELPDLEKMALALEELNVASANLQAKPARTPGEEAQLKKLGVSIEQEEAEISAFFTQKIFPELEQKPAGNQEAANSADSDSTQSYLQNTLAKLGPRVMGVRLLLGENHAYAIVVTANSRKRIVFKATTVELRAAAFEALKALGSPASDPMPQLAQLYAMVAAPLEDELKTMEAARDAQGRVPTLLWSLDDALRYLPIAALYDGQHYMVERFNNVLFTPESYGHMIESPLLNPAGPRVLAMGLSRSYGGLPPLPGVMPELNAVVRDPAAPESHGPMEGKLLPNDQFTLAALKAELGGDKGYPVVHIASHFVVETGSGEEPFLMLGGDIVGDANGFEWNLSDMQNSPVAFHGTRLLTLSACSTAKEYKSRDGLEMDSLGMIAQQKEAEAVLATLWDVSDLSTSRLMSDFYSRWMQHAAEGKAEALRQAQLALLRGPASMPSGGSSRGFQGDKESPANTGLGYSHPYYWAPFVLIGNYQ